MTWTKRSPHDWCLRDRNRIVADVVRSLTGRWLWRVFDGLSVRAEGKTTSRVGAMLAAEREVTA